MVIRKHVCCLISFSREAQILQACERDIDQTEWGRGYLE
jgi:hypothetical protein